MALLDWTFAPAVNLEREFDRMRRQMNDVFGRIGLGGGAGFPGMNIYDQDEAVVVAVQVPGVKKDALNVELRENTLTLTASRQAPFYPDSEALREESVNGDFKRTLHIQTRVRQEGIEADLKNGILLIKDPQGGRSENKADRNQRLTAPEE